MKDSRNHYAKIKKPDIKHHKLYDSIYEKFMKEKNQQIQNLA